MLCVRNLVVVCSSLMAGGLVLGFAGCDNGPSIVSGTVTLDGKPLKQGAISFIPTAGDAPTAGGGIRDGAYTVEAPAGAKRVEITGYEVVGQVPAYGNDKNGPMKEVTKSIVPPTYNTVSNLTAEIKSGKNENVNFELKSK
jgi:hypothetical protein